MSCWRSGRLAIYDIAGREVTVLVDGPQQPGRHTVDWDGRNESSETVPTGLYFARLVTPGRTLSQKLVMFE